MPGQLAEPQLSLQREPVSVYLGLGANLGLPADTLNLAFRAIQDLKHCSGFQASRLYGSAPVDSSGPPYVNAVVTLQTRLDAYALLGCIQAIEQRFGRERPYHNAPRTLDIDLLLYGQGQIDGPALKVPHPRMWQRAFVLLPLAELAPHLVPHSCLAEVADQDIFLL